MLIIRPFNLDGYQYKEMKDDAKIIPSYILMVINYSAIIGMIIYMTTVFHEDQRSQWAKKFD